jgi:superfamily I DNA and RNA helicase
MDALRRRGIAAHLAGVTSSVDEIFDPESIALAHIHRSKGNEAAMVYVINAEQCLAGRGLVTLRNTLFTAMTRSRAWLRVCGIGSTMKELQVELDKVITNNFILKFSVPTADELSKMRQLHRELSATERQKIERVEESLEFLVQAIEKGEIELDDVRPDLRSAVAKYFSRTALDDYDGENHEV